jgi:hypothetical protein
LALREFGNKENYMSNFDDMLKKRPSVPPPIQPPATQPKGQSAFDALLVRNSPTETTQVHPRSHPSQSLPASFLRNVPENLSQPETPSAQIPIHSASTFTEAARTPSQSASAGRFWAALISMAAVTCVGGVAIIAWPTVLWLKWIILPVIVIYNITLPFFTHGFWNRLGLVAFAVANLVFVWNHTSRIFDEPVGQDSFQGSFVKNPSREVTKSQWFESAKKTFAEFAPDLKVLDVIVKNERQFSHGMLGAMQLTDIDIVVSVLDDTEMPSLSSLPRTLQKGTKQTLTVQGRAFENDGAIEVVVTFAEK